MLSLPQRKRCRGFHPLKAGRRLTAETPCEVRVNPFPSPQGGSETLGKSSIMFAARSSFHPLKAGRRRFQSAREFGDALVSIPSRRVGDDPAKRFQSAREFVSIPSRRVGDRRRAFEMIKVEASFHPLKAGRRPEEQPEEVELPARFHPLKAGRRPPPNSSRALPQDQVSIPSRRVGDRCIQLIVRRCPFVSIPSRRVGDQVSTLKQALLAAFPSPQGGSETGAA